jgi:hypothetical protein
MASRPNPQQQVSEECKGGVDVELTKLNRPQPTPAQSRHDVTVDVGPTGAEENADGGATKAGDAATTVAGR